MKGSVKESYDLGPGIRGPKFMINMMWGCFGFMILIALLTLGIGTFFGHKIRVEHDQAVLAAEAKKEKLAAQDHAEALQSEKKPANKADAANKADDGMSPAPASN